MTKYLLHIVILLFLIQTLHSQQDGVMSFNLPVRNSLKFNKFAISPTFSFVREQNKHINFTNKMEWVQFETNPNTYLFGYSGRLNENMGFGISLFQQNYGVLTNFGGVLNYAYNVVLDRDSNLTFGANLGAYSSGINDGNVITNTPDPSLQNIESNFLMTFNPGINYGTTFFDFGLTLKNFALYNISASKMVEEDPERAIQAHIMYTGYMSSRGFFDQAKFTGFIRSEFKQDNTVLSGIVMLMVPKGIWGQVGYNTLFGASAGLGLHLTNQIAIEYNYEKGLGNLVDFGPSHEITLAYRFKNKQRYNYSDEDEVTSIFPKAKRKVNSSPSDEATRARIAERVAERRRLAQVSEEEKEKAEEEAKAKAEADRLKAQEEVEALRKQREEEAKLRAEEMAKAEAAAKAKAEAQAKIRAERAAQAKKEAEEKAKKDAEEAEQRATELRTQQEAQEKARKEAEEKAQQDAEEKARLEAEAKAAAELEAQKQAEEQAAKEKEEAEKAIDTIQLDPIALSMKALKQSTDSSGQKQDELLEKLKKTVASREQDLNDLKEENDLSEQGIYQAPKPFKSISAENAKLEALKLDLENVIEVQDAKLKELQDLYEQRKRNVSDPNDEIGTIYLNEIQILVAKQEEAKRVKQSLVNELETIKEATDFERKRRIKRAAYDNEQDRFTKDMATLNAIREATPLAEQPFTVNDFDFGEDQGNNIKILKGVQNVDEGYYMVIAVHSDTNKRDDFLRKVVASGRKNITFFFDVNTSKYYIYYDKFSSIEQATNAMESKGNRPYNNKMSMIKIEK
ncbi:PorP/SprF family type IX secretion system membrane protein [Winogradskyella sp. A3E31]|uniref:PorP/SprF family type IX secretion system membrane protein n=1 Tax=Winogradskyella sp. A3E31 TaxID=3349637 RepID=UPI00398AF5AE